MAVDKPHFFHQVRSPLFGGTLTPTQVSAMEAIIDTFSGSTDQLAYILATPYHEVGPNLEPVSENLNYSAARILQVFKARVKSPTVAASLARNPEALANKVYGGRYGNTEPGDGWRYRGRGYSQITFKANYEKFGKLLGIDLVADPDLAMLPNIAARILVAGMKDGLFTGKKLSDFITATKRDYKGARAIINADVATNGQKIAAVADQFRAALRQK